MSDTVGAMKAVSVLAQACPEGLVSMFIVRDGVLAVFANVRLIEEPAAVAWAERRVAAGEVFDIWWGDDAA